MRVPFAPVNDHVMHNDVTFLVRRCAPAALEMTSSFVQYDVGNLVLMLNSYISVPH